MNLQESIRRILREENSLLPIIRRRVPQGVLDKEFSESLESASSMFLYVNKTYDDAMTLVRFINVVVSMMIDGIHHELHSTTSAYSKWYDDVYNSLKGYYKDKIETKHNQLMGRILREDIQKKSPLLNLIKSVGLYDFMNETSLSYSQIRSKTGELSREIKIQYLKDVVKNLQQTPNELDLTFLVGSIPLKTSDDGTKTIYVEYLTKDNDVLNIHTAEFDFEGDVDNFNTLTEDELDDETLNVIVDELALNLNDFNKR